MNTTGWIVLIIVMLVLEAVVSSLLKGKKSKTAHKQYKTTAKPESTADQITEEADIEIKGNLSLDGAYQQKWMFTYNEKDFFKKLTEVAQQHNYYLFAKVRLFDLIEPVRNNPQYTIFLNKIKSKHVDFVLCNEKLVAKYIIELDDSSHQKPERKKRDEFVTDALTRCGYKVLHTSAFSPDEIEAFLAS